MSKSTIVSRTLLRKGSVIGNIGGIDYTETQATKFGVKPCARVRIAENKPDSTAVWHSVTFWGANAIRVAANYAVGDFVNVDGDICIEKTRDEAGREYDNMVVRDPYLRKMEIKPRVA